MSIAVEFRFYEELNDFLPAHLRKTNFIHEFKKQTTIKDAIESIGIPHVEIDLILVNGESVDFSHLINPGDKISVYPVFESFDISKESKVRRKPLREMRFILDVQLPSANPSLICCHVFMFTGDV